MREFIIEKANEGKRLDRWLSQTAPGLPTSLAQKHIRQKNIKVNGKAVAMDARVHEGDSVQLYIDDTCFEAPLRTDSFLAGYRHHLELVYEDNNILLINKQPGIMVHPDENEKVHTLLTHVRAYLYQKGEYDSRAKDAYSPVPCNRIDRFTAGIVIFAKNEVAMHEINNRIRKHEIDKRYLCIVHGTIGQRDGLIDNYLVRNSGQSRVSVSDHPSLGAQRAQTGFTVLAERDDLTLLECQLYTGRTHQIRAQLAYVGHPLLGDHQYGSFTLNAQYPERQQALFSYALSFDFQSDAGALEYLNGHSFRITDVPFARRYFPEFIIEPEGGKTL